MLKWFLHHFRSDNRWLTIMQLKDRRNKSLNQSTKKKHHKKTHRLCLLSLHERIDQCWSCEFRLSSNTSDLTIPIESLWSASIWFYPLVQHCWCGTFVLTSQALENYGVNSWDQSPTRLVIAIAKCQRAKILPISARFLNLFRNVMNYRGLRECLGPVYKEGG